MKFSIVIPCYNECESLPSLIDYILPLQNEYELEYILVENGSTDDSKEYLLKNIDGKYKNIKIAYIEKNKGYGFGIQQGLKLCSGDYLGWIHADMQVLPNDLRKIFNLVLLSGSNENIFVKGRRLKRTFIDHIFTIGQSIFSSLIFLNIMHDIGATPVIFSKSLISNFDEMPNDFSIEVFTYLIAKRKKFQVKKSKIVFHDREKGNSSWNKGLISRIKLSLIIIKSSILIRLGALKK